VDINSPSATKPSIRQYQKEWTRQKMKTNVQFRIKTNISKLMYRRIRNRLLSKDGKSTFDILLYTVDELKEHLEYQFETWMSWKNWGVGKGKWNIDHIKPDSSFNYKSVEDKEFQECWALKNLRPLDAIKNIKKGNKILQI